MTEASFLELHDRHCRGGRVADSARRLGLPKDNDKSNSCNGLVIILMIDEDKTKILIVMMLCKGGRSAAGAGRPTQPNPCQCVIGRPWPPTLSKFSHTLSNQPIQTFKDHVLFLSVI